MRSSGHETLQPQAALRPHNQGASIHLGPSHTKGATAPPRCVVLYFLGKDLGAGTMKQPESHPWRKGFPPRQLCDLCGERPATHTVTVERTIGGSGYPEADVEVERYFCDECCTCCAPMFPDAHCPTHGLFTEASNATRD